MAFKPRHISRTLTFRYVHDTLEGRVIPRPRVEIRLINGDKVFRLAMLVDSGADTTFIPKEVAEILELKLSETRKSRSASGPFETASGKVMAVLVKGREEIPLGEIPVIVPVKTIDDNNLQSYALLGRFPFFHYFDITFRERTKKLVLRTPKKR
jgi:predicted aspartyl protease